MNKSYFIRVENGRLFNVDEELYDYVLNLEQESKKHKEVIDKLKEWEQTHTILVYTKEAPRQLVGTHELLHLLYDEDKEVE